MSKLLLLLSLCCSGLLYGGHPVEPFNECCVYCYDDLIFYTAQVNSDHHSNHPMGPLKDSNWRQDLALIERHHVQLIPYGGSDYPLSLMPLHDAPLLLYVWGKLPVHAKTVAVIGTRNCTGEGKEQAAIISEELARDGWVVVSGLAKGIDTAAHLGALKGGQTVAVIGSGLANIYPSENRFLAEMIAKSGAVISELPMATKPAKYLFPKRNRIVSGMSENIVLIEAPCKSGSLNTMQMGRKQGKNLFALSGREDEETSQGNHYLLKSGMATPINRTIKLSFNGLNSKENSEGISRKNL